MLPGSSYMLPFRSVDVVDVDAVLSFVRVGISGRDDETLLDSWLLGTLLSLLFSGPEDWVRTPARDEPKPDHRCRWFSAVTPGIVRGFHPSCPSNAKSDAEL